MNTTVRWMILLGLGWALAGPGMAEEVVFETTSAYHHIKVVDRGRVRTLCFDNAYESRMSLDDPLQGHFEYAEYFHMPWLWNDQIKTVLMIGLGGGSIQRAYQHYYPAVHCETIELDPKVVEVAREYFHLRESETMRVITDDGRVYLRRTQRRYDVILLDAYTVNRYGSCIPYTLVTKEFFALVSDHLTDNGVLAYNVIGSVDNDRESVPGSLYKTLKTCFPQVYLFPAISSRNIVMVATKSPDPLILSQLKHAADGLIESKQVTMPGFKTRLDRLRIEPPAAAARSPVLTDDFAPVEGALATD